jgi:N-acyl-L-homoserine lactone synthetase
MQYGLRHRGERRMKFIGLTAEAMPGELLDRLGRYRYRVFVERLQWELASRNGMEFDQFDRPDTRHVLALRDDGELIGCARLLPTERPYLLAEVFPQLMAGAPVPRSPEVWEISRFAAVDLDLATGGNNRQFASPVTPWLLRKALSLAASAGVKQLVSVSPPGIERILRRLGFAARCAGDPVRVGDRLLMACMIDVPGLDQPGRLNAAIPALQRGPQPPPCCSRPAFDSRS